MILYYVIAILDRSRGAAMTELYNECRLTLTVSLLGSGTATSAILSKNGISAKEKAVITAVAGPESLRQLTRLVKRKMQLDVPGNGIMMAIPIKSVGGRKTLSNITEKTDPGSVMPEMHFDHELIIIILNEGHSEEVMDIARAAGATGGTILHAKGSGVFGAKTFFGVSLEEEKDVIYIAVRAEIKTTIMRAINTSAGRDTPSGAVCFSLPISSVVGIREPENDD